MFKSSFIKASIISLLALTVVGCGSKTSNTTSKVETSSQTTSQNTPVEPGEYYNEDNFIVSDRIVNKSKVKLYDGPSLLESSKNVSVKVEDQEAFVYETRVNHRRSFTYDYSSSKNPVVIFDFEGRVHVDIEVKNVESISNVKISPLIYGINPEIENNHIKFTLDYHDNYIIEYNNDSENVIHFFTNEIEENPITEEDAKKDSSIVYIGPGVYESGAIPVASNSTIYLAGGAYVYGQIRTEGLENITIKGRGIISGEIFERRMANEYTIPVEIRTTKHVTIEGITFLDPAGWCIALYKSEDVHLNNVKIITARANGDGISVQSCKDVYVTGGFVRSWDDSLVVKNVDRGNTENVNFDGVTVWTDLAQSMEIGFETYGPTMKDITFKNITVVHNFHKPVISLHNSDDAAISNVKYEHITLEDGQMLGDDRNDGLDDFFIDMTIAYSPEWTKSQGERGNVDGVMINNVKAYRLADTLISRINGESNNSKIKNVTIKDIDYASKKITSEADLDLVKNNYTENIKIENTLDPKDILGAIKTLPYKLELDGTNATVEVVKNIEQSGLLVPEFAYLKGEPSFIGAKLDTSKYTPKSGHGSGKKATTALDENITFEDDNHKASAAFDNNQETYYQSKSWLNIEDEFAALTIDFGEDLHTVGVIRVKGPQDNKFKYEYTISIFGRKIKNDGTVNPKYTRIISDKKYTLSPANGNIIDINISAQEYAGLELRFFKEDGFASAKDYKVAEVEFYAPSLTYNKPIVSSTEHNDVYPVSNVNDGDATGTSYYESKTLPAHIIIDLEDVKNIKIITLALNPSLLWEARTQNIEISISSENRAYDSKMNFETLFAAQDYVFDPQDGNRITLNVPENGVNARFIKIVINSNSASGGYGAQLAEISAFGN